MNSRQAVLDASALLVFILREEGYETIAKLVGHSVVPAPTFVETLYRAKDQGWRGKITDLAASLKATGLEVEPLLEIDCERAAELIAGSKKRQLGSGDSLSLGDGLCIAVAERIGGRLITEDVAWHDERLSVVVTSLRSRKTTQPRRRTAPPVVDDPAPTTGIER